MDIFGRPPDDDIFGRPPDDAGASAVEYGLIVFAIAALIAVAAYAFGEVVTGLFAETCTALVGELEDPAADCTP